MDDQIVSVPLSYLEKLQDDHDRSVRRFTTVIIILMLMFTVFTIANNLIMSSQTKVSITSTISGDNNTETISAGSIGGEK